MTSITMMVALVFLPVGDHPQIAGESAPSTEVQVWDALHKNALAGFAGTLTFDRKKLRPGDSGEVEQPAAAQHWSITTDGRGSLRAEVISPYLDRDGAMQIRFGRTPVESWIWIDDEVLVLDHDASPAATQEEEVTIGLMRNLIRSAERHLKRLLGGPSLEGSIEMLMVDRTSLNPSAVVKVDGQVRHMEFQQTEHGLFRTKVIYSDDVATYKWNYSEYREVGNHWVPAVVEFHQVSDTESWRSRASRYSRIGVAIFDDPNLPRLREALLPPHQINGASASVVVLTSVSDNGVTYDSWPFSNE